MPIYGRIRYVYVIPKIEVRNCYIYQSQAVPKTKMRINKLSLIRKLTIAEDDINDTARKYKILLAYIRK